MPDTFDCAISIFCELCTRVSPEASSLGSWPGAKTAALSGDPGKPSSLGGLLSFLLPYGIEYEAPAHMRSRRTQVGENGCLPAAGRFEGIRQNTQPGRVQRAFGKRTVLVSLKRERSNLRRQPRRVHARGSPKGVANDVTQGRSLGPFLSGLRQVATKGSSPGGSNGGGEGIGQDDVPGLEGVVPIQGLVANAEAVEDRDRIVQVLSPSQAVRETLRKLYGVVIEIDRACDRFSALNRVVIQLYGYWCKLGESNLLLLGGPKSLSKRPIPVA